MNVTNGCIPHAVEKQSMINQVNGDIKMMMMMWNFNSLCFIFLTEEQINQLKHN